MTAVKVTKQEFLDGINFKEFAQREMEKWIGQLSDEDFDVLMNLRNSDELIREDRTVMDVKREAYGDRHTYKIDNPFSEEIVGQLSQMELSNLFFRAMPNYRRLFLDVESPEMLVIEDWHSIGD
jgi:hypothetical protein